MPHIRYQVFFKNPVYLTILLSLVISCPYFPFVDGTVLAERITSGVLFSTFIVGAAYLLKKSRVIAAILTLLVVFYLFVSYCEVGNFLVMGQSFNTEFWQFFDIHAIKLVMDTAPFLFWGGIIFLVLIVFSLFQAILNVNRYNNRTKWSLSLIPAIMLIGLASNAKYSSFTQMTEAYMDYSQMLVAANSTEYLRKILPLGDIHATPGKNIVHIYLESLGDIYTDNNRFPGLTPNLTAYKNRGICAEAMLQTKSQANSYMGHLASECGRYCYIQPESDLHDLFLGQVLKKAGYNNVFMRGAGADMAGPFTALYSKSNGYNTFISRKDLDKKYDASAVSGFGYSDDILFKEALEQYKKLLKGKRPFNLTVFTLDTHGFPQGLSETCKSRKCYDGPFAEDEMVQAVHCTDFILGAFINELSRLPKYEDLIIVIHGDHVQHMVTPAIMEDSQSIYAVIFGEGIKPYKQTSITYLMDLPETILSLAGIKTNAMFYVGEDFSKPIIREQTVKNAYKEIICVDKNSFRQFNMMESPNVVQIGNNKLDAYEDENIRLSYMKLDGSIFSSLYIYVENKQTSSPFYVLYPMTTEGENDISSKTKGILLQPDTSAPFRYKVGVSIGVKTMWANVLVSDLNSGLNWGISLSGSGVTANTQGGFGKQKQPGKKQIFHTEDPQVFSHLDQMKYISQNNFEVLGGDPKMYINLFLSENSSHLLVVDMESPHGGIAQIYYELNDEPYCELNSSKSFITAGKNTVSFFLSRGVYNKRFRFDIGVKPGIYKLGSMTLYALESNL